MKMRKLILLFLSLISLTFIAATTETAVVLEPEAGNINNSRGLSRSLTGTIDRIIEEFQSFPEWAPAHNQEPEVILHRGNLISELKVGIDPFTAETLEMLEAE